MNYSVKEIVQKALPGEKIGCTAFWGGIQVERHHLDVESQQTIKIDAFSDNARANYLIGRGLLAGGQRETALNLRYQLLGQPDPEHDVPIMVSWFDAAETLSAENGNNLQFSPSVLIFSNPLKRENRRNSI